jgi:hypothetical protein
MVDTKQPAPAAKPAEHEQAKAPLTHSPYETKPAPLPPQGSKDYVAGQPVDEEEQRKVDGEHDAKLKAAAEEARKAEQRTLDKQHHADTTHHTDTASKK